jgi:integrase
MKKQNRENPFLMEFLAAKRPATARAYSTTWRQWCRFRKSSGVRATPKQALAFISKLRQEHLSDNTIALRFAALQSIYAFLEDMGSSPDNPFRRIKRVFSARQKVQVRPTRLIALKQVIEIIESPPANTRRGVMQRALLALLFGAGLRRSEARNLRVGDVMVSADTDAEGQPIYGLELAHTKAGKRQQRRLPAWAWEYFSVLVSQRKEEGAQANDFLFVFYYRSGKTNNRQLSEASFYRYYRRAAKAAPHSARATFATALLSAGYAREEVADALGHSTDTAVKIYDKRVKSLRESVAGGLNYADFQEQK